MVGAPLQETIIPELSGLHNLILLNNVRTIGGNIAGGSADQLPGVDPIRQLASASPKDSNPSQKATIGEHDPLECK